MLKGSDEWCRNSMTGEGPQCHYGLVQQRMCTVEYANNGNDSCPRELGKSGGYWMLFVVKTMDFGGVGTNKEVRRVIGGFCVDRASTKEYEVEV